MTWAEVARKDLEDAIRARWLWVLSILTILAFTAPIVQHYYLEIGRLLAAQYADDPTTVVITYARALMVILVPLIAIVMSYASITRERDSGSIKVLLSLPHSRRAIVTGKFLGRSAAVAIPIAVALVVGALLLAGIGGLTVTDYALFGAATLLLVVTIAGVGVGLSALMDTTRRAILASIAAFAIFFVFWNPISGFLAQGLASLLGAEGSSPLAFTAQNVATLLNPFEAYKDLVAPQMVQPSVAQTYESRFGSAPLVLRAPFSIFVLAAWTFGSLLLGSRHFERIDL